MVEAINHDTGSTIATSGWEAAKGALIAGALVVALPVVGAIAGAALGTAILGAFTANTLAVGFAGVAGALLGGGAGLTTASALGSVAVASGAVLGLGRGANKVSREISEYNMRVNNSQRLRHEEVNLAENAGLQHGYQAGFQEGQAFAVQQIQRELQAQAVQSHQHEGHQHGGQHHDAQHQAPPAGGFAARELERRGGQPQTSKADLVAHQKEQAATQQGHHL